MTKQIFVLPSGVEHRICLDINVWPLIEPPCQEGIFCRVLYTLFIMGGKVLRVLLNKKQKSLNTSF